MSDETDLQELAPTIMAIGNDLAVTMQTAIAERWEMLSQLNEDVVVSSLIYAAMFPVMAVLDIAGIDNGNQKDLSSKIAKIFESATMSFGPRLVKKQ